MCPSPEDSTPPAALERQARGRAARNAGYEAEGAAAETLQAQGVRILERNFRCKTGEIDIIGLDKETLIFVEVRLRKNQQFGGALESITPSKQQRIANAARYYLMRHPKLADKPCRFDCVLMSSSQACDWLRDAFRLD